MEYLWLTDIGCQMVYSMHSNVFMWTDRYYLKYFSSIRICHRIAHVYAVSPTKDNLYGDKKNTLKALPRICLIPYLTITNREVELRVASFVCFW